MKTFTVKQLREAIAELPDDARIFTQDEWGFVQDAVGLCPIRVVINPNKTPNGIPLHDEDLPGKVFMENVSGRERVNGYIVR